MRHIFAKRSSIVLLLLSSLSATAQNSNKENSPYSRFGIGEMRNSNNVMLRGMGSASVAYAGQFNVNTANPASYSSLKLTTYEAAGEANTRTIQTNTDKYRTGMATLSYMHIGIPMGKYMGMALGLRPISRVYYRLNDTTNIDSFGSAIKGYQGDGSLNQGFVGFGGKYKGISLGFNFGYVFGNIENISSLDPLNSSTNKVLGSGFLTHTRVGGVYWDAGASYEYNIREKLGLRVGATFAGSQQLIATKDQYWMAYRYETDTVFKSEGQRDKIVLPTKLGFGVQMFNTGKWAVGADFTTTNWSQYRNFGLTDSLANGAYKISVGGEYTPDINETRKYLQRVTYRLGAYYGTDPVMLRGVQLDYYAITAGMTLPFKKNTARLQTSIEIGSRGTTSNGLIRENFVKFGLGISLNDKWFIKRKYE
jgi:hypothetical protein